MAAALMAAMGARATSRRLETSYEVVCLLMAEPRHASVPTRGLRLCWTCATARP